MATAELLQPTSTTPQAPPTTAVSEPSQGTQYLRDAVNYAVQTAEGPYAWVMNKSPAFVQTSVETVKSATVTQSALDLADRALGFADSSLNQAALLTHKTIDYALPEMAEQPTEVSDLDVVSSVEAPPEEKTAGTLPTVVRRRIEQRVRASTAAAANLGRNVVDRVVPPTRREELKIFVLTHGGQQLLDLADRVASETEKTVQGQHAAVRARILDASAKLRETLKPVTDAAEKQRENVTSRVSSYGKPISDHTKGLWGELQNLFSATGLSPEFGLSLAHVLLETTGLEKADSKYEQATKEAKELLGALFDFAKLTKNPNEAQENAEEDEGAAVAVAPAAEEPDSADSQASSGKKKKKHKKKH
jgi:ElaB/YqjD/DUF883 family membrane-anchored ribosome-binding protein